MEEFHDARIAYEAYCKSVGGKSAITGDDLPSFYKTPRVVQVAWDAAAKAVSALALQNV